MKLRGNFSQSPRIGEKRRAGIYEIYAFITIAAATTIRILLAAQGWPLTNSDEDTIGIMAMRIAYRGEHPIFFYGQNYMGTLEAYLGAALFHIDGYISKIVHINAYVIHCLSRR